MRRCLKFCSCEKEFFRYIERLYELKQIADSPFTRRERKLFAEHAERVIKAKYHIDYNAVRDICMKELEKSKIKEVAALESDCRQELAAEKKALAEVLETKSAKLKTKYEAQLRELNSLRKKKDQPTKAEKKE